MSDLEYDIVDELYFVTNYLSLKNNLKLSHELIFDGLKSLLDKEYIIYFTEIDGIENPKIDFTEKSMQNLLFLASKKGLLAHNSR